jgi:hypothetical protein
VHRPRRTNDRPRPPHGSHGFVLTDLVLSPDCRQTKAPQPPLNNAAAARP